MWKCRSHLLCHMQLKKFSEELHGFFAKMFSGKFLHNVLGGKSKTSQLEPFMNWREILWKHELSSSEEGGGPPWQIWSEVLDSVLVVRVAGVGGKAAPALEEPPLPLPGGIWHYGGWKLSNRTWGRWPQRSGGRRPAVQKWELTSKLIFTTRTSEKVLKI